MRTFITYFFWLLTTTVGLTLAAIILLEATLINDSDRIGANKVDKFYSAIEKYDCAILGSSRARGCYVPSVLNAQNRCFNFGLKGTGNKIWYYMLLDELSNPTGRRIIVNVDRGAIKDGEDFNYNNYLKAPKASNLYRALEHETKSEILPWPLYYFGNMKSFIAETVKEKVAITTVSDNGFVGMINAFKEVEFNAVQKRSVNFSATFEEKEWKDLFDRIGASKDTVIFVIAPVYKSRIEKKDYEDLERGLSDMARSYHNIAFYDMAGSVVEKKLFHDPYHLRMKGAISFSKMLRDSIDTTFGRMD